MIYSSPAFDIDSNVPFPELDPASSANHPVQFQVHQALSRPGAVPGGVPDWFHQWELADGRAWLSLARSDGGYLLRFHGFADFLAWPDVRRIQCYPHPDTQPATIRHLLLDQVLPLVLAGAGRISLHASGVALPGQTAAAFLGPSGSGKSMLAAGLAAAGCPLVADDWFMVEEQEQGFLATPSYRGLRLWPDSRQALLGELADCGAVAEYTTKERVNTSPLAWQEEKAWLRCLYLLQPPEELPAGTPAAIRRLRASEVVVELVKHSFVLDMRDPVHLAGQFEQVSQLAARLPAFALSVRRQMDVLPAVCQAVIAHAQGLHETDLAAL